MGGEYIIIAGLLIFAIAALFYVADDLRELLVEDAPDDDPYLNRLCREIEGATRKDTGGDGTASDSTLVTRTNGPHSHDVGRTSR